MTGRWFPALFARLCEQPRLETVPCLAIDDPRFAALATEGYPVVIDGSPRDPREIFAHLRASHGDHALDVRTGPYDDPEVYAYARTYESITLSAYLAALQNPVQSPGYAANQPLSESEAIALGAPPPFMNQKLEPPSLWLGPAGTRTPLHKDSADNFSIQVVGKKRWTLFPIRDAPLLDLRRTLQISEFSDFAVSRLDLRTADPPPGTRSVIVEVKAGQTLYVPAGWSHFVEAMSSSLTINYWADAMTAPPWVLR